MRSLAELQDAFGLALEAVGHPPGDLRPLWLDAGWQAYRNNHLLNRVDALSDAFPVVRALVGDEFFRAMARVYTRATPSHSANLFDFGASLAMFIEIFAPAADLPYLADVARLDWACHRAALACDAEPLCASMLAAMPAAALEHAVLGCHPSLQLLHSAYPVGAIWRAHQPDYAGDWNFDDAATGDFAIARRDNRVDVYDVTPAHARFLASVGQGATLGEAIEMLTVDDGDFDLGQAMLFGFANGIFVSASIKETAS